MTMTRMKITSEIVNFGKQQVRWPEVGFGDYWSEPSRSRDSW